MEKRQPSSDQVAIVTGGASGIGKAVARLLARRGAQVIVADIDGSLARLAAAEMEGRHTARSYALDVRDADGFQAVVDAVAREYGSVDYLFNNAGVGLIGRAKDMGLADWKRILEVDLYGVVHGVQAAYPLMVKQGSGHIVNTASIMGLTPSPLSVAYATAKHAVVGLSTSLRAEGRAHGVKVSVVCPGFIDTPMKHANHYLGMDQATALRQSPFKLHPVEDAARDILDGVERNLPYIVLTKEAKWMWRLHRASPGLYDYLGGLAFRFADRKLARSAASAKESAG